MERSKVRRTPDVEPYSKDNSAKDCGHDWCKVFVAVMTYSAPNSLCKTVQLQRLHK